MMNKLFSILILFGILFWSISASAITCLWDASTTGGTPSGYVLEWTDGTTVNTKTIIGATQTTIENKYFDMNKPYTFRVYAYNDAGKSDYSNSVVWTRTPYIPPTDTILVVKLDVPTVPSNAKIQ